MRWARDYRTIIAVNGRIALVNTTADAWVILDPSVAALERVVERVEANLDKRKIPGIWWSLVRAFPTTSNAADVQAWLLSCGTGVPLSRASGPPWICLLASMRLEHALLWPALQVFLPHPGHPHFPKTRPLHCMGALSGFEREIMKRANRNSMQIGRSLLLSMSPLSGPDDISGDAFLAALDCSIEGWKRLRVAPESTGLCKLRLLSHPLAASSYFLSLFRTVEGLPRSDGNPVEITARAETVLRSAGLKGQKSERWGTHSGTPEAKIWIKLFERFSASLPNRRLASLDDGLMRWLDFLSGMGQIPQPCEIVRTTHVVGDEGFLSWIGARYEAGSVFPSRVVSHVRRFFAWHSTETGQPEPIVEHDVPRAPPTNNKSNKTLTPREVIQTARSVVRELIEFAYGQVDDQIGARFAVDDIPNPIYSTEDNPWGVDANTARWLPTTLRRPSSFEKYLVRIHKPDGSQRTLLSPVLPTFLLLLLTLPIRALQARLLDSGEADERMLRLVLAPMTHPDGRVSHQVDFKWVANRHLLATAGRRTGAIRSFSGSEKDDFLGFFVNTNKTQASGHSGIDIGYEIPWQHPELLDRINRLRLWQEQFNPADRLVSRNDISELESDLAASPALGKLPSYVFLFRQFDEANLSFRQFPVTETACRHFFNAVIDEVEGRLVEQVRSDNANEPDLQKHKKSPVLVELRRHRRLITCVYTLHSLRLSGITAFAEAGVPAPIIAEFMSGHLTVLMAIYYMRFGPAQVTSVLAEAERLIDSGLLEDSARQGASLGTSLLLARFVSEGAAAVSLAQDETPGFWKWFIDGICPNGMTRCEEGGPPVEGHRGTAFGPVVGGPRNCPMCRFWLTGPRFIAGQIIMANATLHKIRARALGLRRLWEQQRDPENAKKLNWIRDKIDKAEADIDLLLRSLNARVRLVEKSLAMARQPCGSETPGMNLDLITRMHDTDIHMTARETSELGYLEFMSRAVRLFPEIEAHDAPVELGIAIDRLLDENGFRGCLYKLPEDMRAKAGIAFMDCLRAEAPLDVHEDEFVDEVARGKRRLFQFDTHKIEAEMSNAAGRAIRLEPLLLPQPDASFGRAAPEHKLEQA